MRLRNVLRMGAWLLPASPFKNKVLRALGHELDARCTAGPNLVWNVEEFRLGPGSRVAPFNVFRHLKLVDLGPGAFIGRFNTASCHPVYGRLFPQGAQLLLGPHAVITSKHALDCAGGIEVGEYSYIAGNGTRVLTHALDLEEDAQSAFPVRIGTRSFVGTSCLLLGGAELPARSVLAAGAVLTKSRAERDAGLWAGVPARFVRPVSGAWFDRSGTHTRRMHVPGIGMFDDYRVE